MECVIVAVADLGDALGEGVGEDVLHPFFSAKSVAVAVCREGVEHARWSRIGYRRAACAPSVGILAAVAGHDGDTGGVGSVAVLIAEGPTTAISVVGVGIGAVVVEDCLQRHAAVRDTDVCPLIEEYAIVAIDVDVVGT